MEFLVMRKLLFGGLFLLTAGLILAQDPKAAPPVTPPAPKPAPAPAPAPADATTSEFFPLVKGSSWTYASGTNEIVVKVKEVTGSEAKLVTEFSNKEVANETIVIKADGIYRTKINDTAIDGGGVKILALKDGKPTKDEKWAVASKIQTSEVKGDFVTKEVGGKLKVAAGEMVDVVLVEGAKFTIANTETSVKYWFSPKFGIVKLEYSIGGNPSPALELKQYKDK